MSNHNKRLTWLFERYIAKTATAEEMAELSQLVSESNDEDLNELLETGWQVFETTDPVIAPGKANEILQQILDKNNSNERVILMHPPKRFRWMRQAVAASILLVAGLGSYFLFFNHPGKAKAADEIVKTESVNDIEAPKATKAIITLADGRSVPVDSLTTITQSNVQLSKTPDGKIFYQASPELRSFPQQMDYNTLTNPRGSKVIDMTLADGSHVWLNAGSSVTYPVAFIGKERKVTITGEAYFEVAHDATRPFYVNKGDMSVQVLGTHFNVNAYDDEADIKVTLLEGSVRVSMVNGEWSMLKPGQQAVITHHSPLTTHDPDPEQVMAWKNGLFIFDRTDIQTLMRSVSRWYDVDIVYADGIPTGHITGKVPRSTNLLSVLKVLEYSGIKFLIEDKKIIVKN